MHMMWASCLQRQAFWSALGVCSEIMGQSLHVEMHDSIHAFKTAVSERVGLFWVLLS